MSKVVSLEPELARYIEACNRFSPLAPAADVSAQRQRYIELCRSVAVNRPATVEVKDTRVVEGNREIPIRIYDPGGGGVRPGCLFIHGGGWVVGNLDSHDDWAAEVSAQTGAVVLAVDYRLSPENRYPAALEDVYAVLCHAWSQRSQLGIDRLAVYGDSSGGNLAAAVSMLSRDRSGPPVHCQVLVYPALCAGMNLPSHDENANGPVLTREGMAAFWNHYLGEQPADGYASPDQNRNFADLPPAHIVAAEHDPLRDDARYFADALIRSGVQAELYQGDGLVHGCYRARHQSPVAARAFNDTCQAMKRLLRESPH